MIFIMKAEWQKLWFRRFTKIYLFLLASTSMLLGIVFSLTTNTTQGRTLSELSSIQVITANLLGIDVGAIMLIIFTAMMIASDFTTKLIHVSLAITPQRLKFFAAKFLTFSILSLGISILITMLTFSSGQVILVANGMTMVSLSDPVVLQLLVGCAIMPVFYCLLTVCLTFFFRSSAGSISFSIGVMLLPALTTWFNDFVQQIVLPILPRAALHSLSGIAEQGTPEALTIFYSVIILALWLLIPYFLGAWNFMKKDV